MSNKTYYIATGLQNAAAHKAARKIFEANNVGVTSDRDWTLTYDWTVGGKIEDDNVRPSVAIAEVEGVKRAWLLLMLLPGGRGTHTEQGIALACDRNIIIVAENDTILNGGHGFPPVFYRHPRVQIARTLVQAREIAERLYEAAW